MRSNLIRRSVFLCALSSCFCEFFGEKLCLGLDKTALPADVRAALLAAAAKSADVIFDRSYPFSIHFGFASSNQYKLLRFTKSVLDSFSEVDASRIEAKRIEISNVDNEDIKRELMSVSSATS